MQYRSSSTILWTPRTWPSMRRSRPWICALCDLYPGIPSLYPSGVSAWGSRVSRFPRFTAPSAPELPALDEVAVPAVEPGLPGRAVDRQHPRDLSVLQEMKRVVAVESVGRAGRVASAPLVQPALRDLGSAVRRHRPGGRPRP